MGRPPIPVKLDPELKVKLQLICKDKEALPLLKRRCQAILMADKGHPTSEIAQRIGTNASQVSVWRRRFSEMGYLGLVNPQLDAKLERNRQKELLEPDP